MDLKDLYREVILDHNKSPRQFGRLDPADSSADASNCGFSSIGQATLYSFSKILIVT